MSELLLVPLPGGGRAYIHHTPTVQDGPEDVGPPRFLYYSQGDGWTCPHGHGNPTNAPRCRWLGCAAAAPGMTR